MRFYEHLYVGEKAKSRRFEILQSLRKGKSSEYYVMTLPEGSKNVLDLYPAAMIMQPYYMQRDPVIIGIALDFRDAAGLAASVVSELYQNTGGFELESYLNSKKIRE